MPSPLHAEFSIWTETLIVIGIGVTVIVCLGALAERLMRGAVWQRTLWQMAVLAILSLMALQVTGLRAGLFFAWRQPAAPQSPGADTFVAPMAFEADWLTYDTVAIDAEFKAAETPRETVIRSAESQSRSNSVWHDRNTRYLPIAFLLGTAACLLRIVWGRLALFALTRRCVRADGSLDDQLHAVARTLGIRRRVWLWIARSIRGPLAFGTLRPTILVPETFAASFDRSRRQVILAHELAHLAAFDPFWQGLANLLCAVLWWHPCAWWMRRRLRSASEAAADEASLLVPDGPELLADCLVEMGRQLLQPARLPGLSVEGSGFRSELGRRVERLLALDSRTRSAPRRLPLTFVKIILPPVLVLAALSCTAWAEPGLSLSQPAEGDATMNVWKSSWRGSLAASALCALWNPVAMAAEQPADGIVVPLQGDVRFTTEIPAEAAEPPPAAPQTGSIVKFVRPNADFYYVQATDEQARLSLAQLDQTKPAEEDRTRQDRRERLQRQQRLAEEAGEVLKKLDALGEGHETERKELNDQLDRIENELRGTLAPAIAVRVREAGPDAVVRFTTPAPGATRARALPAPADNGDARLQELKRAVAELESTVARNHAIATRSGQLYVGEDRQWRRTGVIKSVGLKEGSPVVLSIDMQDGTVLGLEKLGEGVDLTLRGKPATIEELKPETWVVLTWSPVPSGWKLHTINAEPVTRARITRAVPQPPVTAPAPAIVQRPRPRTDPILRRDRNTQELEGQVERMRGQMDELQKQISELRDLLKQKPETEQPRR